MSTPVRVGAAELRYVNAGLSHSPEFTKAYVILCEDVAVLVDPGPASQAGRVLRYLRESVIGKHRLEGLLITHIHLDHYGAAPLIAEELGVPVYVHPRAYEHVLDPSKLWEAAVAVLGGEAHELGKPKPMPRGLVRTTANGEDLEFGSLRVKVVHTPGHSPHHQVFIVNGKIMFSGDACGGYVDSVDAVFPTSPPGLWVDLYLESLAKLSRMPFEVLAPTHMSVAYDGRGVVRRHLRQVIAWLSLVHELGGAEPPTLEALASRDVEVRKIVSAAPLCPHVLISIERGVKAIMADYARVRNRIEAVLGLEAE